MGSALAQSNSGDNHYAGSSPIPTIENLFHATPGGSGLNLSSTSRYLLMPDLGVQVIPMEVYGHLPWGTVGLILGRSSTTIRGLQVYPGVTDEDYTGEIKIMAQVPGAFVTVSPEEIIA
jgi:dUTPase